MPKGIIIVATVLVALCLVFTGSVIARTSIDSKLVNGPGSSLVGPPAHCLTAHRVGRMVLAINNNGTFGTGFAQGSSDCFSGQAVRSCEYPINSHVEYLFAGAFWIGAVVGRDTLVSVGADGWIGLREMYPDESPFGDMIYRSIIDPSMPEFEGAISEEDYIARYSDTFTEGLGTDEDGLSHRPLNIEVTQSSYAWSYSYAENMVLFDYVVQNIGTRPLEQVYMGLYVDADVCFDCDNTRGFTDDVCGFLHTWPAFCEKCEYVDTVNIAWIADNDGDFNALVRAPHVTGMRIVRTPAEELDVSFNWWISNGNVSLDFGPRELSGKGRWEEEFRTFRTGGLGTPSGDRDKYYTLRNQEFDYPQAYSAAFPDTDTLWRYHADRNQAADFADGYDTRYLLSFGPFDINPGDRLPISFAYIAGIDFHTDINNYDNLPDNPSRYEQGLNFDSLASNSKWASWIYDNPGVDTDSDGYAGEVFVCVVDSVLVDSIPIPETDPVEWEYTFNIIEADSCWITGDGIPDFRGASPPPSPSSWSNHLGYPAMRVTPETGKIKIRFNGLRSESTRDVFSNELDFEGYRVYISRDDREESFSVIESYDVEDYNMYIWDDSRPGGAGYVLPDIPYKIEALRCAYADSCGDTTWNPLSYSPSNPMIIPNSEQGQPDSLIYFAAQDFNVSRLGQDTRITKPAEYADQDAPINLIPEEADPDELTEEGFFKYYEYEIDIEGLLPTISYYVNITAFDFGSPSSGLPSLESRKQNGAVHVYPQNCAEVVERDNLKAFVYPNPFRIDAEYPSWGFEAQPDPNHSDDRLRRIHFANLPEICTISIYSLDGDLVREIEHDGSNDVTGATESWDLITRNTQSVVSGIYYWTIDDNEGNVQIGKLVVIM